MTRIQGIVPILITVLTALLTIGCATGNDYQGNLRGGYVQTADDELHPMQLRLVEAAHWAEGRNDVSCDGRSFAMDCSGVVSAVYWKAGIGLQAAYPLYTGNGVTRIYRYLDDKRLLYRPD